MSTFKILKPGENPPNGILHVWLKNGIELRHTDSKSVDWSAVEKWREETAKIVWDAKRGFL